MDNDFEQEMMDSLLPKKAEDVTVEGVVPAINIIAGPIGIPGIEVETHGDMHKFSTGDESSILMGTNEAMAWLAGYTRCVRETLKLIGEKGGG